MRLVVIVCGLVLAAVLLFSEYLRRDRQGNLEAKIAREIELRKIRNYGAGDPSSPSQMIANPPPAPIEEVIVPLQLRAPLPIHSVDPGAISEQFEHDQIRRDIDSIKRQVELERMNQDLQRREDQRRAAQKDREHFLGLDRPQ